MGVYIKGMKMPKSCRYCTFRHMSLTQNAVCTAAHEEIDYMAERTKRLDNCPLAPVPPHGRLIDADEIPYKKIMLDDDGEFYYGVTMPYIDRMPTIITAEEGET